jgi:hypothetical protein
MRCSGRVEFEINEELWIERGEKREERWREKSGGIMKRRN